MARGMAWSWPERAFLGHWCIATAQSFLGVFTIDIDRRSIRYLGDYRKFGVSSAPDHDQGLNPLQIKIGKSRKRQYLIFEETK